METNKDTIVWAVDPFEDGLKPSEASLGILRGRHVLPVAISTSDHEIKKPQLDRYLKDLDFIPDQPTEVLIAETHHREDFIKKLVLYALDQNASCIALTSRGLKGIDRLITGSFAEKLLDVSPLPVLFLTDKRFNQTGKAFFSTDFSEQSETAFRNFIQFCKGHVLEIVLFYVEHPSTAAVAASAIGGVPVISPNEYFEISEIDQRNMERWVQKYSSADLAVKISPLIKDATTSISKEVMKAWDQEHVELFGISSSKTSWQRTLYGSVAHDVFMNKKSPVWIWGINANEPI